MSMFHFQILVEVKKLLEKQPSMVEISVPEVMKTSTMYMYKLLTQNEFNLF